MFEPNSNHGSFLFKNNENTYPKGRALMKLYRVVPQTKRGNNAKLSLGKQRLSTEHTFLYSSTTELPLLRLMKYTHSVESIVYLI